MKNICNFYRGLLLAACLAIAVTACKKDNNTQLQDDSLANSVEVISATPTSDAVLIVNVCSKGLKKDSVVFSTLPAPVSAYIAANYAGYTVQKSFKISNNSTGVTESYAVIIQFNGKPVGLKFDPAGNFLRIFEQREKGDIKGKGWHHGGRFDCRDEQHRDSIAVSGLPAAVKSYFTANYPADTLVHALVNKDGAFVVISANKGLYASVFSAAGAFVKRELVPAYSGKRIIVSAADMPLNSIVYLTTTFPGYVINKAFTFKINGNVQGYVACIDVNGTKYAVQFNAAGSFVKQVAIR